MGRRQGYIRLVEAQMPNSQMPNSHENVPEGCEEVRMKVTVKS